MASVHVASRWCKTCQAVKRCERQRANHILHLLLTLVTAGFWIPIWFLCGMNGAYHCKDCGRVLPSLLDKIAMGTAGALFLVIGIPVIFSLIGSGSPKQPAAVAPAPIRQPVNAIANAGNQPADVVPKAPLEAAAMPIAPADNQPAAAPPIVAQPVPGEPIPAAEAVPADPPAADPAEDERKAAAKLKQAIALRLKSPEQTKARLQAIINEHPETEAAKEAAKLLSN